MPTTYFAKQDAAGLNNGLTLANAFTDPNSLNAVLAAGDTAKLCQQNDGSGFTQTWTLGVSGTAAAHIHVVGCDSSGAALGPGSVVGNATMVQFNGQSARASGIVIGAFEFYDWSNISCDNHTSHGWSITSNADGHIWIDCQGNNNGGSGMSTNPRALEMIRCTFNGNSAYGINNLNIGHIFGCQARNNGTAGIGNLLSNSSFEDCIFDDEPYGIDLGNTTNTSISRCTFVDITNTAINNTNVGSSVRQCVFHSCAKNYADANNTDSIAWISNGSYNPTAADSVAGERIVSVADDVEASDPFVDKASENYNLTSETSWRNNRRYYDASNNSYGAMGALEPIEYTLPDAGDVRDGVTYGTGGDHEGTLGLPAVGDVQNGVQFGEDDTEFTGTFVAPTAAQVLNGIGFGAGGTEFTGNVVLPSANDVQDGVTFGPSSGSTGVFEAPATTDVRDAVGYGANGTEYEGNVELPDVGDVRLNTQYGANGTELTGTLPVGTQPIIRSLSPAQGTVTGGIACSMVVANAGATQGTGGVTFGGTAATISSWSDTLIVVVVPAGSPGSVDVVLTIDGGATDTYSGGYTYIAENVNSGTVKNLATGKFVTGAGSRTAGPDGKTNSAITITTPIQMGNGSITSGTIALWRKAGYTISGVSLTDLDSIGTWFLSYATGAIPANVTLPAGDVFDVRIYSSVLTTDDLQYLYDDMNLHNGENTCPLW